MYSIRSEKQLLFWLNDYGKIPLAIGVTSNNDLNKQIEEILP